MENNIEITQPKKRCFLKKVLWVVLFLLVLLIFGVALLLSNPHWLSPLIEKQLSQYGVKNKVVSLESQFASTKYQLQADSHLSASQYGIEVPKSQLSVELDWWDLIKGNPFVHQLAISDTEINLTPEDLKRLKEIFQGNSEQRDFSHYFPQAWSIENSQVRIQQQPLLVSGHGIGDKQANLFIKDAQSGQLNVAYDKSLGKLTASSQHIELQDFTGVQAVLRDFNAQINTKAWLGSRVSSWLDYQGVSARIQIDSEHSVDSLNHSVDDEVLGAKVRIQSDKKSLTVWLAQQEDNITARLHDADLSIISILTPLLPRKLRFEKIQGKVSGAAIISPETGLEVASLALSEATVFHQYGGVGNANATLVFDKEKVTFFARLKDSPIYLPTVFPKGFAPLTGRAEGDFQFSNWQLTLREVVAKNADVKSLKGKAIIGLKEKHIDISASAAGGNVAKTSDYLPEQLPLGVRKWLKKALISGEATKAKVIIKGRYPSFIHRPETVLNIDVDLKNARLHYLKNNPDLLVKKGRLLIDRKKILVEAPQAEIFTRLKGKKVAVPLTANAVIQDYLNAIVEVDAKITNQPSSRLLPLAKSSLAAPVLKQVDEIVRAKGKMNVGLGLVIGVSDENNQKDFDINLSSNSIDAQLVKFPNIQLKQAKFTAQANQDGLKNLLLTQAKDIDGRTINLEIDRNKIQQYVVHIDGRTDILSLLSRLKLLSEKQRQLLQNQGMISGASKAKATLLFNEAGDFLQVQANSNLQGTKLSVFKLLTKASQTQLPMTMRYQAAERKLALMLQRRLKLVVGFDKSGSVSGILVDNLKTGRSYRTGKRQVYYHGQSFDFARFNQFRKALAKAFPAETKETTRITDFSKDHFDINIRQVNWDKKRKTALIAKGYLSNLDVKSPFLSGKIQYQPHQLNAQLSRIDISWLLALFDSPSAKSSKKTVASRQKKTPFLPLPKKLPAMRIQAEKVYFSGNEIGKASIRSSAKNGLYGVEQFLLSSKDFFFELSGYEKKATHKGSSHFQLDFKGERIVKIADLFKLNPVIDGKFLDVSANLSWAGKIHDFNPSKIYGDVSLTAQNIKLRTVKAGAGSLFGLMDIVGILKRITLDFKNLSSSKISFDTVEGKARVGNGKAVISDLQAKGSLVSLLLSGDLNIVNHTFDDVELLVIPKASNIIPIVGAVAGGVVGGAIGVLVQQIMGGGIDEAVGVPYVLSGPWETPKLISLQEKKQQDANKKALNKQPTLGLEGLINQDSQGHNLQLKLGVPAHQVEIKPLPPKIELESIVPKRIILESVE